MRGGKRKLCQTFQLKEILFHSKSGSCKTILPNIDSWLPGNCVIFKTNKVFSAHLLFSRNPLKSGFQSYVCLDIDTDTPTPPLVAAVALVCWMVGWLNDWTEMILLSLASSCISLSRTCSAFFHLALPFGPGPQEVTSAVYKLVIGQSCA